MDIKLELNTQISHLRRRRDMERVRYEVVTDEINKSIDYLEHFLFEIEKQEDNANDTIRED